MTTKVVFFKRVLEICKHASVTQRTVRQSVEIVMQTRRQQKMVPMVVPVWERVQLLVQGA